MSHPPPSGSNTSNKSLPANLPARPPPSAVGSGSAFKNDSTSFKPAFAAFAPRAVAASAPARTNSPAHYSAQPTTSYSSAPSYTQPSQDQYAAQSYDQYYQAGAPQIRNPFIPTAGSNAQNNFSAPADYDPDYEAQIQQWQSAYMSKDDKPNAFKAPTTSTTTHVTDSQSGQTEQQKTVKREGGGTTWTDSSLLEWDPAHFRLFVGNLAGEVTDESLHKAFARYISVQKARVIRDKRTTKSKGYGFVSFSDGDDYFLAAKEMNGKYIGSHPVTITKAKTEVRPSTIKNDRYKKGKGSGGHGKVEHGGIKKTPKTKGGLKVLG